MEHESSELIDLFTTYTAGPDSIGHHLTEATARATASAPLLVATATDLALYPGDARPPTVLAFRLSTRGFKELAAVSHLGPALASLVALRETDPRGVWRADAERLLASCRRARAVNSVALWRDAIAVYAYRGRAAAIAAMIDYALGLTIAYLERALAVPSRMSHRTLQEDFLEDHDGDPVSFDRIMIATFYLVGMDVASRLIAWLDEQALDWAGAMVLITGKQGRPTAGVTWRTNSVAAMILAASRGALGLDRLYIAPHAPTFPTPTGDDLTEVIALEPRLREIWTGTRAVLQLGADMFPGYPAFATDERAVTLDPSTEVISDMPAIAAPDDWFALITRLRLVMEDPRQLLSGAVGDFAAAQLVAHDNDPTRLVVPGLDGEPYPRLAEAARP